MSMVMIRELNAPTIPIFDDAKEGETCHASGDFKTSGDGAKSGTNGGRSELADGLMRTRSRDSCGY